MAEIKVVEKTPGTYIKYAVDGSKITFGEDELTINLAVRERDYEVNLDICKDSENGLVLGTGCAEEYLAQVVIPARRYDMADNGEDENGEPLSIPLPVTFDISLCTLILWGMEVAA
jgi:hypothetical protein